MSNHSVPPKANTLHALEVSPEGVETAFCNLYSGTADLPAYLQSAIEGGPIRTAPMMPPAPFSIR